MLTRRITLERSITLPAIASVFFVTMMASGCTDSGPDPQPAPETLLIEAASATQLQGTVGEAVNTVPTIIVKTPEGKPVPGISVTFTLVGGAEWSGSVSNGTAISNKQGIATPGTWTLGTKATSQELTATLLAEGPPRSVKFRVIANAAAPAKLSAISDSLVGLTEWSVDGPAVGIYDRFHNRVKRSDVVVKFSLVAGDGLLAKTEVHADSSGVASAGTWILGPNPGLNSVTASADGLGDVTITALALDKRDFVWYDLTSISVVSGSQTTALSFDHGSIGLSPDGYFVGETFYDSGRSWVGGKFRSTGTDLQFAPSSGEDPFEGRITENGLFTFGCSGLCFLEVQRTYTRRIEAETPSAARSTQH